MANPLGEYIADGVKRAESDFKNARDRSFSLIGVTGALVAFTTGLTAFAAGSTHEPLSGIAKSSLVVSMILLVVSVVIALSIHFSSHAVDADPDALLNLVRSHWNDSGWDLQVAEALSTYWKSMQSETNKSVARLQLSLVFQILGISALAVGAIAFMTSVK